MALMVEDGTGLSDADAYVSLEFVDAYHTKRGNTVWTAIVDDAIREACIVRASDYVDKRFGVDFRGIKSSSQQALQWPRIDAFDNSGYTLNGVVPTLLQKAVAEYALRALIYNVLAPDAPLPVPEQTLIDGDTASTAIVGEVVSKTEKVGPIEESTTYRAASETSQQSTRSVGLRNVSDWMIPTYPEADLWLEELITDSMASSFGRG